MTRTLSVIVPTVERGDDPVLFRTISNLLADRATSELIVVIDRGGDGFAAAIEAAFGGDPRARSLHTRGAGETGARQAGLEAATGDVVLFLDDDVEPLPGLASGHASALGERMDLVVAGYMPVVPRPRRPGDSAETMYAVEYESRCRQWESGQPVLEGFWAGNFSLAREAALRVGMTSSAFDGPGHRHGDRDFGVNCTEAGLHGLFLRELASVHHFERSVPAALRDVEENVAGGRLIQNLHGDHQTHLASRYRRGIPDWLVPLLRPFGSDGVGAAVSTCASRLVLELGRRGRFSAADFVYRTARFVTEVRASVRAGV